MRYVLFIWLLCFTVWTGTAVSQTDTDTLSPNLPIAPIAVGDTVRVSLRSNGSEPNGDSLNPHASADGRYLVFTSTANDIVSGDGNNASDIFRYDRQTGQVVRVSIPSGGGEPNFDSFAPVVSDDGRYVAYCSYATNLVGNDTNNVADVFYRDLTNGITGLASQNLTGVPGNDVSCGPSANLLDARGPDISGDGRYIVFESFASDLIGNDNNSKSDIFRFDRQTGSMVRVSVDSNGAEANGHSRAATISSDGLRIAFESDAANLVTGDGNNYTDIFLHNLSTGNTRRISVHSNGSEGNGQSLEPEISADGLFVVFSSFADNLVSNDDNNYLDVFIRDRNTDQTYLASVSSTGEQPDVFADMMEPTVSEDGRFVAFQSYAANLAPGEPDDSTRDVFVRDRQLGTTIRASVSSDGQIGNASSREPALSADGFYVLFSSKADNLVTGDANDMRDIFAHQLQAPPPPPPPPAPTVVGNYFTGAPGSVFAFTGSNWGNNTLVSVYANNIPLGLFNSDAGGTIAFRVRSTAASQSGAYLISVTATTGTAVTSFILQPSTPTRPLTGTGPVYDLPPDSALGQQIYLPVITH